MAFMPAWPANSSKPSPVGRPAGPRESEGLSGNGVGTNRVAARTIGPKTGFSKIPATGAPHSGRQYACHSISVFCQRNQLAPDGQVNVRISEILAIPGPNIWSPRPTLEIRLLADNDIADPGLSLGQLCDRIQDWFPEAPVLQSPFAMCLDQARHSVDVFAAVVIELQNLAGTPVERKCVELEGLDWATCVAVEFVEESIARMAVDIAARLVWATPERPLPDFDKCLGDLQKCGEQCCLGGTTGPIVAAARARGIPVGRLDGDCLVQLGHGARQRRIMGSLTNRTGFLSEAISRDKSLTKQLLRELGIPVPAGRLVADADDAWAAACALGLPVVVKPRDEDCGVGVSLMLKTREQVASAYIKARDCRPDVLVERHLPGAVHRLFVVDDRLVAAVRRDPPQVSGDGQQSVAELVAAANRDPRRGDGPDQPLYPIAIDDEVVQTLADQQLTLDSVPVRGQAVALRYDPKAGYGGTLLDVTECVHAETAAAVLDSVRVTGLDVAGVDLMASDISLPLEEQGGGVLEVNGGPAIYLHRSPFCEPSRPVAEAIVNSLIPMGQSGRIPIVAVIGDAQATTTTRTIASFLKTSDRKIGLATAEGVFVDSHLQKPGRADNAQGCRTLLLHPRVELAVCEISLASLREEGLAFDECQVAVLAAGPTVPLSSRDSGLPGRCLRVLLDSVPRNGFIIVNVADPWLKSQFKPGDRRLIATALDASHPFLQRHREHGGATAFIEDENAVITCSDRVATRRWLLPESCRSGIANESSLLWLLAFATECVLGPVVASCQLAKWRARESSDNSRCLTLG
jgi:cyanophycin synthetase